MRTIARLGNVNAAELVSSHGVEPGTQSLEVIAWPLVMHEYALPQASLTGPPNTCHADLENEASIVYNPWLH